MTKLTLEQTKALIDLLKNLPENSPKDKIWGVIQEYMKDKAHVVNSQNVVLLESIKAYKNALNLDANTAKLIATIMSKPQFKEYPEVANKLLPEEKAKYINASVLDKVLASLDGWKLEVGEMLLADAVASEVENDESKYRKYFRNFVRPQEDIVELFKSELQDAKLDIQKYLPKESLDEIEQKWNEWVAKTKTVDEALTLEDLWYHSEKAVFHLALEAVGHGVGIADDEDDVEYLAEHGLIAKDAPSSYIESPYDEAYQFLEDYDAKKKEEEEDEEEVESSTLAKVLAETKYDEVRFAPYEGFGGYAYTNDGIKWGYTAGKGGKEYFIGNEVFDSAADAEKEFKVDVDQHIKEFKPVESNLLSRVLADVKLKELEEARANNPYKDKKHIAVTYQTVTPESAEIGDFADHGYEDFIDCTPDEDETAVELAIEQIKKAGASQPSSSSFHKGVWYDTADAEVDYSSGEEKTYGYHLNNFTEEEEKAVWEGLKAQKVISTTVTAAAKEFSGLIDKTYYIFKVDNVDTDKLTGALPEQLEELKKLRNFKSNAQRTYVNAKGKPNKKKVLKDWIKEFGPTQYLVQWHKDHDDDSLEVFYVSNKTMSTSSGKLTIYYVWRKEKEGDEWTKGGLMTVMSEEDLKKFKEDTAEKAKRRKWAEFKVLPEGQEPVESSVLARVLASAKKIGNLKFKHGAWGIETPNGEWFALKDQEGSADTLKGKDLMFDVNENDEATDVVVASVNDKPFTQALNNLKKARKEFLKRKKASITAGKSEAGVSDDVLANEMMYAAKSKAQELKDLLDKEGEALAKELKINPTSEVRLDSEGVKQFSFAYSIMVSKALEASLLGGTYFENVSQIKEEKASKVKASEDDEFEEEEQITPDHDTDAFITPSGPLGSKYSVSVEGKHLGEFTEIEDAEKALKDWMQHHQYWPSVWFVSDHGNISPHVI